MRKADPNYEWDGSEDEDEDEHEDESEDEDEDESHDEGRGRGGAGRDGEDIADGGRGGRAGAAARVAARFWSDPIFGTFSGTLVYWYLSRRVNLRTCDPGSVFHTSTSSGIVG